MPNIVERFIWKIKIGCVDEFLEMAMAERERFGQSGDHGTYRLYSARYGPIDTVVGEWVFEDEEQQKKAWAEWSPQPEAQEWIRKANELIEGATREVWYEY
jgi:hypothetical protein